MATGSWGVPHADIVMLWNGPGNRICSLWPAITPGCLPWLGQHWCLNVLLKIFPRLFMRHSNQMNVVVPDNDKRKLSAVLPFFMTNDLDLAGLNFILAHAISFSRLRWIHLLPYWCSCNSQVVNICSNWRLAHSCLHHWSSTLDFSRFHNHINSQDEEGSWEHTASNDIPHESMPVGNYYPGGDSHLKVIIIAQD